MTDIVERLRQIEHAVRNEQYFTTEQRSAPADAIAEIEALRTRVAELEKHALTEDQCWFYQTAIDVVHAHSALDAGCPAQAMLKTAHAAMMKAAGEVAGERDGHLIAPEPPR